MRGDKNYVKLQWPIPEFGDNERTRSNNCHTEYLDSLNMQCVEV
jgi:hypothetical protein